MLSLFSDSENTLVSEVGSRQTRDSYPMLVQCWATVCDVGSTLNQHRGPSLYVRLWRLYASESDVCRRQILTYKDGPRTERIKIFPMAVNLEKWIGIQMKQKELTKAFMTISKWKNPLVASVCNKYFSALRVKYGVCRDDVSCSRATTWDPVRSFVSIQALS